MATIPSDADSNSARSVNERHGVIRGINNAVVTFLVVVALDVPSALGPPNGVAWQGV